MWGINADVLEADVSPLIEKHTGGGPLTTTRQAFSVFIGKACVYAQSSSGPLVSVCLTFSPFHDS